MSESTRPNPEELLRNYFHAKDENRPHLIQQVFCEEAILEMNVKTENISFPALTHGAAAIADVLVSSFGQVYENVYTFYMQCPPAEAKTFNCDWLVGMSEKSNGHTRVGCGRYEWSFQSEFPYRVDRLVITVEAMQTLPAEQLPDVLAWLLALPYPWCSPRAVCAIAPDIAALGPVLRYLGRELRDA